MALGMVLVSEVPVMMPVRCHQLNVDQVKAMLQGQVAPGRIKHGHVGFVAPTKQ
jgi:hypothetical protein